MDRNCHNCKLGCGQAVPGAGPDKPRLIVISDYPGKKEVEYGFPMAGDSGQLLRRALSNVVGLNPEKEVFYTNVIRCYPNDDKGENLVGEAELIACKRWTTEEFKNIDCNLVLIAGGTAFKTILPHFYEAERLAVKSFNIAKAHGNIYTYMGRTYLVTWNPAYVMMNKFKDPRKLAGKPQKGVQIPDWYPLGSMAYFFLQDMLKLKELIITYEA